MSVEDLKQKFKIEKCDKCDSPNKHRFYCILTTMCYIEWLELYLITERAKNRQLSELIKNDRT